MFSKKMNFSLRLITKHKKSLAEDDDRFWFARLLLTTLAFGLFILASWLLFTLAVERPIINSDGKQRNLAVGKAGKATPPCVISIIQPDTCEVRCDKVGGAQPPGHLVASYIAQVYPQYKDRCPSGNWYLSISDTPFPGDVLDSGWFHTEGEVPAMSRVELRNCGALSEVQDRAFSTFPAFGNNLRALVLSENRALSRLHAGITDGLGGLDWFSWQQNGELENAEMEVLRPFSRSLQTLQIQGGFSSPSVLANLTGLCQEESLPLLTTLYLGDNPSGMSSLGLRHLAALESKNQVLQLTLARSNIAHFEEVNVFEYVSKSVKILDLSNNLLQSMKNGTFDDIVASPWNTIENKVKIYLEGNPWHCDCHLQWLQDMMLDVDSNIDFEPIPTCGSPTSEKGRPINVANLNTECDVYPSEPPAEISCGGQTTTTATTSEGTTNDPITTTSATTEAPPLTSTEPTIPETTTEVYSSDTTELTDEITSTTIMTTESATDSSTTSMTTETSTTEPPYIKCSEYITKSNHNKILGINTRHSRTIRSIVRNFLAPNASGLIVYEKENDGKGNITVVVERVLNKPLSSIIWRPKGDYDVSKTKCYTNIPESIEITNYQFLRSTSYQFCMLDEDNPNTAYSNCEPLTTSAHYTDRPLFTNDDKTLITIISISVLIMCVAGSAMIGKLIGNYNMKRNIKLDGKKLASADRMQRFSGTSAISGSSIPSAISVGENYDSNIISFGTPKHTVNHSYV